MFPVRLLRCFRDKATLLFGHGKTFDEYSFFIEQGNHIETRIKPIGIDFIAVLTE